jgi:MFS family permease
VTVLAASVNLWSPAHVSGFAVLAVGFLLGVVHGVTPDEHTWPITFSYAVSGYSSRRGLRVGLTFSLAFTLQRALASELAAVGLGQAFTFAWLDYVIYVVVGVAMFVGGLLIVRRRRLWHFHLPGGRGDPAEAIADPRPWMPAVHGFVAGWGFGAFALIIYTVLAPAEPVAWGWAPGAAFGLGTTAVQVLAGAAFGRVAARRHLAPDAVRRVALRTAGATLTWGGVLFVAAGVLGLVAPRVAGASFATGVRVHNLDQIGLAFVLVMVCVLGVGVTTLVRQTRAETRRARPAALSVPTERSGAACQP